MENKITEIGLLGIIGYMLFFNSTAVNPTLAFIYTILLIISFAFIFGDNRRQIPLINKSIPWSKALLIAGIAYVILIGCSFLASSLAKVIPLKEILGLLGASAPVFSNSPFFNFINFALLIPYLESFAIFVIAIDFFTTMFKIDLNKLSIGLMMLFVIIASAFLLFHSQVRGIENESSLILVFLMAMISCILVFLFREGRVCIMMHVFANSIGLLAFSSVNFPQIFSSILPILNYVKPF